MSTATETALTSPRSLAKESERLTDNPSTPDGSELLGVF